MPPSLIPDILRRTFWDTPASAEPSFGNRARWPRIGNFPMLQSGRRGRLSDVGNQWIGLTIDCDWAGPMARFYEGLLGFEVRVLGPGGRWAQLFHPDGGVHINIQGDPGYESPTWPEQPGELAKMMHFEVQVDDLDEAINRTLELGGAEAPWQPPDRNRERIRVMLDPAGHPLCLFLRGE
jgi:hypothetical protein